MADIINGKAISAMKVVELQQELQRRGMNRNGRKSDLVERLRKSMAGEEEESRVDQALSGDDAVCTSKEESLTVSADEALLSTDEAVATTEEEIHPDSTCTTEIASECMQQPHVSSSTGEGGPKGGGSVVEGVERMDGDGELEVHLVGKDLQEFEDEGAGEEGAHKESPMAKRRKLNLAGAQSAGGSGARRKPSVTATSTAPVLGVERASAAPKDRREAETDMDATPPLGGMEGDNTVCAMMPTSTQSDGGGLRRSISAEVDEEYEKLRKEKERERESLRHKIELQKKEQAKAEAREAEERRALHAKELEKQAKELEQQQLSQKAAVSAEEKSQRMEAKKHREELRRSMEEIRERRRSEARNRAPLVEEKLELGLPRGDPSHVLHIQHLTRPFTNQQLEELLGEEGSLVERAFWTDKRKSFCYAAFRSADEAHVVAKRLHGLKWPSHNKRALEVEFVSAEEAHRGSSGSFEAPGVSQLRDETPPLEELERSRAGQGLVHRDEQEAVPKQDIQLPQAAEQLPVERKEEAQDVHPTPPPEQTAPPPVQVAPPPQEDEGNTLDKLFRKTVAKPHIYWLPLTEEQAQAQVEGERQRVKDREARQRERVAREREEPRSRDRDARSRQQDRR